MNSVASIEQPAPDSSAAQSEKPDGRREPSRLAPVAWVQAFVFFELACQILLLVPILSPIRIALRCAAFGASLAMLVVFRRGEKSHPARVAALIVLGILFISFVHPTGNSFLSQFAQVMLYAAILAPLFWVSQMGVTQPIFRRIILTFWAFHAISSGVGVLQVYVPRQFEPPLSQVIQARGRDYVESLKIKLPSGASVFRPMGLTDQPGGAATAGLYTILFGLGLLLSERSYFLRGLCLASMALALFCLYLSQVRSILAMTAICLITFCALLALRGEVARMLRVMGLLAGLIIISFLWAVGQGGDVVTKRLSTLVQEPAGDVYYSNRGHFLEETVTEFLPQFPMGAGLGRWGMMNSYFGDPTDRQSETIWVEIQWTGWLLDGGVPLILAYVAALGLAFYIAWRIAMDRGNHTLGLWGALIFAYNMAAFAVTFNYPLFIGQGGLEFWLLNAALFTAWRHEQSEPPPLVLAFAPVKRFGHAVGEGYRHRISMPLAEAAPLVEPPTTIPDAIEDPLATPEAAPIAESTPVPTGEPTVSSVEPLATLASVMDALAPATTPGIAEDVPPATDHITAELPETSDNTLRVIETPVDPTLEVDETISLEALDNQVEVVCDSEGFSPSSVSDFSIIPWERPTIHVPSARPPASDKSTIPPFSPGAELREPEPEVFGKIGSGEVFRVDEADLMEPEPTFVNVPLSPPEENHRANSESIDYPIVSEADPVSYVLAPPPAIEFQPTEIPCESLSNLNPELHSPEYFDSPPSDSLAAIDEVPDSAGDLDDLPFGSEFTNIAIPHAAAAPLIELTPVDSPEWGDEVEQGPTLAMESLAPAVLQPSILSPTTLQPTVVQPEVSFQHPNFGMTAGPVVSLAFSSYEASFHSPFNEDSIVQEPVFNSHILQHSVAAEGLMRGGFGDDSIEEMMRATPLKASPTVQP